MEIFVTGYGAISSIGNNVIETLESLLSSKTGIQKGKLPHSSNYLVGEIHQTNDELISNFKLSTNGSRTGILGTIAAKEAFLGHKIDASIRTGVISGTSVGGMDVSEIEYRKFIETGNHTHSNYTHHSSGNSSEQIATELGIDGFVNTISTACSSAANAIMMGARMIRQGMLDRVIVGGTDGLSGFTINGFRSLMIFDDEWCRPFDDSRKGLNLGEGAGYIVIESAESIEKSGSTVIARLRGWSNASDAYHQTASSPDGAGATLSMKEALKVAGLQPTDIDYINAHGTATPNNDLSESQAIINVFGENIPPFSSTKAYTGHTLAASGGIEAVIAVLSIQHGYLFPNLNHRTVIEETKLQPIKQLKKVEKIRCVLSNSFGFGGNNSTIIISE